MPLERLPVTVADLAARKFRVLGELHPEIRLRVSRVIIEGNSRFAPYCGFRGLQEQEEALRKGASNAHWLESPHNYRPALACDVVLHPSFVRVRAHKDDPRYPDLWDDASPDAVRAWRDLEVLAEKHGLERVDLRPGVRDRPHLQLPGWKAYTEPM